MSRIKRVWIWESNIYNDDKRRILGEPGNYDALQALNKIDPDVRDDYEKEFDRLLNEPG